MSIGHGSTRGAVACGQGLQGTRRERQRRQADYHLATVILGLFMLSGCNRGIDCHIACTLDGTDQSAISEYLLYRPPDYEADDRLWPLVLFLHGAGEVGTDLEIVKEEGLPQRVADGWAPPFILVSPQARSRPWAPDSLVALLDHVQDEFRIDPDRIYVTGLSMGGAGTWSVATAYPDRFAAAVPICGYGDPGGVERLREMPIWVFHGAKDDIVPLTSSRQMVDGLKDAGADVRFTIYPEADHDSWTAAYATDELYDWMLSKKK
jgi:predicted peptidase